MVSVGRFHLSWRALTSEIDANRAVPGDGSLDSATKTVWANVSSVTPVVRPSGTFTHLWDTASRLPLFTDPLEAE